MQQIADWLEKLGMSEYAERFAENRRRVSVWSPWFGRRWLGPVGQIGLAAPSIERDSARLVRVRVTKLVNTESPRLRTRRHGEGRNGSPWLAVSEFALAPFGLRC